MTALPLPVNGDRPQRGPWRPRRDLVPLSHEVGASTAGHGSDSRDEIWFLGAGGVTAHLRAPDAGAWGSLRLVVQDRGMGDRLSLCEVFVSQVPAGAGTERCLACMNNDVPPRGS